MIGKRFLALLLVVCIVFGMVPVQVFAATGGTGTLTLNEPQQVHVENRQDWYYFAFTPEVTGVYEFKGTCATHWEDDEIDTYAALYNANPLTNPDAHMLDEENEYDYDYDYDDEEDEDLQESALSSSRLWAQGRPIGWLPPCRNG